MKYRPEVIIIFWRPLVAFAAVTLLLAPSTNRWFDLVGMGLIPGLGWVLIGEAIHRLTGWRMIRINWIGVLVFFGVAVAALPLRELVLASVGVCGMLVCRIDDWWLEG